MPIDPPRNGAPNGSVPELVDDGVTGFVRHSEAELAEALGHIDDLDRSRCRTEAVERFSTQRMVASHVALYESIRMARDARNNIV